MTRSERISRAALLQRAAAAAGAAYVAPALTSSAAAEATACAGTRCKAGKKGHKKCRKAGGKACKCPAGGGVCAPEPPGCEPVCTVRDISCGGLQVCPGVNGGWGCGGNGVCFVKSNGRPTGCSSRAAHSARLLITATPAALPPRGPTLCTPRGCIDPLAAVARRRGG